MTALLDYADPFAFACPCWMREDAVLGVNRNELPRFYKKLVSALTHDDDGKQKPHKPCSFCGEGVVCEHGKCNICELCHKCLEELDEHVW